MPTSSGSGTALYLAVSRIEMTTKAAKMIIQKMAGQLNQAAFLASGCSTGPVPEDLSKKSGYSSYLRRTAMLPLEPEFV